MLPLYGRHRALYGAYYPACVCTQRRHFVDELCYRICTSKNILLNRLSCAMTFVVTDDQRLHDFVWAAASTLSRNNKGGGHRSGDRREKRKAKREKGEGKDLSPPCTSRKPSFRKRTSNATTLFSWLVDEFWIFCSC